MICGMIEEINKKNIEGPSSGKKWEGPSRSPEKKIGRLLPKKKMEGHSAGKKLEVPSTRKN